MQIYKFNAMKKFFFISAIFATMLIFSCKTQKNVSMANIKADDTITVNAKDTVSIVLVSNPSTGYRWYITENSNEKSLKFIEEIGIPPDTKLIGAAGKQKFNFYAKKKGNFYVKLEYRRGDKDIKKTHTSFIIVK